MRQVDELLLNTVIAERSRLICRQGLLAGNAKLGNGGASALSILESPRLGGAQVLAREEFFTSDIDVLNCTLTLEHLEATFYREAVEMFDAAAYMAIGFQASVRDRIVEIADHEKQHVDALTSVIGQLEGEPVEEATYIFGYTDLASFLATAAVIEGVGVAA